MPVPRPAPQLILNLSVLRVPDQRSHSGGPGQSTAFPARAADVRAGSQPHIDQELATTPPGIEGSAMRTPQTRRRSLRTTLTLVALSVTALLAPATFAVASPTHPQAPRAQPGRRGPAGPRRHRKGCFVADERPTVTSAAHHTPDAHTTPADGARRRSTEPSGGCRHPPTLCQRPQIAC